MKEGRKGRRMDEWKEGREEGCKEGRKEGRMYVTNAPKKLETAHYVTNAPKDLERLIL